MVEERIYNSLLNMGYQKVASNVQGIYLFYHADEDEVTVISVYNSANGDEMSKEQYENILYQIRKKFKSSFSQRLLQLNLILTHYPERTKHLCSAAGEENHWFIDLNRNRLMIYENQQGSFGSFKPLLENLLEEERLEQLQNGRQEPERDINPYLYRDVNNDRLKEQNKQQWQTLYPGYRSYDNMNSGYYSYPREDDSKSSKTPGTITLSLFNTIIIVLNIIIYLVYKNTQLFGGQEQMYYKGALSWIFIREDMELYRLLTSMFMHADLSHLLNNMLVLFFVGDNVERAVGKVKYLIIYFASGILAGITSFSYNMWKEYSTVQIDHITSSIGASGAIFGIVGAMLYMVIINRGKLEDVSTRQVVLFVVVSLYGGIMNAQIDQAAHIGGFLAGIILAIILYRRPKKKEKNISGI